MKIWTVVINDKVDSVIMVIRSIMTARVDVMCWVIKLLYCSSSWISIFGHSAKENKHFVFADKQDSSVLVTCSVHSKYEPI